MARRVGAAMTALGLVLVALGSAHSPASGGLVRCGCALMLAGAMLRALTAPRGRLLRAHR